MHPLVHEKLDEFLEQEIIVPVTEPTDWVSSLTYSWKANGKLQVCLDPKYLNAAICHDHYHTPTLDEITHKLGGSTHFTKLDGTSSYLCVALDYESSLLTMFNTPWGHYRFVHLPWGLTCAQDFFQQMMDQILECCKGIIGIADDDVHHRLDDEEHDQHLHTLMQVAGEHGFVFNGEKCAENSHQSNFLAGSMTRMAHTQTPPRLPSFTTCQPLRCPVNCKSSLAWSHTCLPLCPLSPPLLHPSVAC